MLKPRRQSQNHASSGSRSRPAAPPVPPGDRGLAGVEDGVVDPLGEPGARIDESAVDRDEVRSSVLEVKGVGRLMQAARRRDCQPVTEPLAKETYGRDDWALARPPDPPPAWSLGVADPPVDQDADVADLPGQPDPPLRIGGVEVGPNHQPDHEPLAGLTRARHGDARGTLTNRLHPSPRKSRPDRSPGPRPEVRSWRTSPGSRLRIPEGCPRGHDQPRDQPDSRHMTPTQLRGQGVDARVVGRIGRRNRFVLDPALHDIVPVGPPKRPSGHRPDFNEPESESRQCLDRDGLDIDPASEPDWRRELQSLEGSRQPPVGAHVTKEIDRKPADG